MEKMKGAVGIRKLMETTIPVTAAGVSGKAKFGAAFEGSDLDGKAERLYRWANQIHDRVCEFPSHPELWARGLKRAQDLRAEIEAAMKAGTLPEFGVTDTLTAVDRCVAELAPWAWAGYHPGLRVPWWRWRLRRSSLQGR